MYALVPNIFVLKTEFTVIRTIVKSEKNKPHQKCLTVRALPDSLLGLTIDYIQQSQFNNQAAIEETVQARFLTFALDRNDPRFPKIAVQSAIECEAWAKAIREYAGLPATSVPVTLVSPQIPSTPLPAVNSDNRLLPTQPSEDDIEFKRGDR